MWRGRDAWPLPQPHYYWGILVPRTHTPLSDAERARANGIIGDIATAFSRTVVGQDGLRRSLLIALIAGGHILLESVPGLAKTTAAHTLARSIAADFRRIQCTPDLLPSDIIGTQIYDNATGSFKTQLGPVHANFVLLDEINRSSAKTQSAMLEAMQERQTSIGGTAYALPEPFLVMATQNPIEQEGTYQLPEAQMDRFLLKEIVRYPSQDEELEVLHRIDTGVFDDDKLPPANQDLDAVRFLQLAASRVYVDDAVRRYIVAIVHATRNAADFIDPELARYVEYGGSPRASIAFLQASRALALLAGRDYVIPDDIKSLRHEVLRHRVILGFEADADDVGAEELIDAIFAAVPAP